MDTRKIIDYTQDGNAVGVREALYASIWDKVHAAIEAKKQELAMNLIAQEQYEGPGDDEEDDWDEEDDSPYNELDEGKTKISMQKAKALRVSEIAMKKEAYDDEEDPDVRIANREIARQSKDPRKAAAWAATEKRAKKINPDRDISSLAKRTPKEKDED